MEKKTAKPSTGKTNSKIKRTYKLQVTKTTKNGKSIYKLTEAGMI